MTTTLEATTARSRSSLLRSGFASLALALLVGCCAFAGIFAAKGGQWYVVSTPSMGAAAPVGTLLWVEPVTADQLHRGDIVSFQPPGSTAIYSHRLYRIDADGTMQTKGDVNTTPDPWKITARDVRGEVVMRWWAMGWVIRALPVLLGGGILLGLLVSRFVRPRSRPAAVTFGVSLLLSASLVWLHPLVQGELVSLTSGDGHAMAKVISTGLLPGMLTAKGIDPIRLTNGHIGHVRIEHATDGHFVAHFSPDVPWWLWALLLLVCLSPAAGQSLWRMWHGRGRSGTHRCEGNGEHSPLPLIHESGLMAGCPENTALTVFRPTPWPRQLPSVWSRSSQPLPSVSLPRRPRPHV